MTPTAVAMPTPPPLPVVTPFFHAATHTFSYLVACPVTGAAAIIDPCLDFDAASGRTGRISVDAISAAARAGGLDVVFVLETHAHADHLSAAQVLLADWPGATLGIGAGITEVQAHFRPLFGIAQSEADAGAFGRLFASGERFGLGAMGVEVIPTPGHTDDSVSYRIGNAVFIGDTLFQPDVGTARCDFPGGSAATLYRSIQRLLALPGDTRMFVAHDYPPAGRGPSSETTVAAQRADNIHVGGNASEASFVALRTARDATLGAPQLLLPSLQVNLRGGKLPAADANGTRYLRLPMDAL